MKNFFTPLVTEPVPPPLIDNVFMSAKNVPTSAAVKLVTIMVEDKIKFLSTMIKLCYTLPINAMSRCQDVGLSNQRTTTKILA